VLAFDAVVHRRLVELCLHTAAVIQAGAQIWVRLVEIAQ